MILNWFFVISVLFSWLYFDQFLKFVVNLINFLFVFLFVFLNQFISLKIRISPFLTANRPAVLQNAHLSRKVSKVWNGCKPCIFIPKRQHDLEKAYLAQEYRIQPHFKGANFCLRIFLDQLNDFIEGVNGETNHVNSEYHLHQPLHQ
jgi:hypothetical protein